MSLDKLQPGTYRIIESHGDKVFRIALRCGVCETILYDFFGVDGRKFKIGAKRKLDCPSCIKGWEYRNRTIRIYGREPYPKQQLIKDERHETLAEGSTTEDRQSDS